jgi:hypothetical protein
MLPLMTSARATREPTPLFVFGVCQRTGTHFLHDLLTLHPDCDTFGHDLPEWASRPEDWLWAYADAFERYLDQVGRHWRPEWDFGTAREVIIRSMGEALDRSVVQLWARSAEPTTTPPRYVVTKTPSTRNLTLLLRALPGRRTVVIVRDGRDVVESGRRTWKRSYERWMRIWREGADDLLAALDSDGGDAIVVVHYEDITRDLEGALRPMFVALDLDPDVYDWAAASSLPVSGSSTFRPDHGRVTWEPVQADRQKLQAPRWDAWPRRLRLRFAHVAGAQMRALGYDVDDSPPAGRAAWDRIRDLSWDGLRRLRKLRDAMVGLRRGEA